MTALPSLTPDDFAPFFQQVHGHRPFPWQDRLLRAVVETGWPPLLDLPTGSGKTAVLDVAVFALALAAGTPRLSPLRVAYVVDRRTIVDQAHTRAERIRAALLGAGGVVERVRRRLSWFTGGGAPLQVALLRGGIARDDAWARTPDQPLILVSTVDQVGSRLLFRGYGVSDSMRPVHAGLLGADALYLLDEVHLSQPFRETLQSIAARYRTWAVRPVAAPFVMVEMSATPGGGDNVRFSLDSDDRQNPVLARRLAAKKPANLVSATRAGFVREVEKHAVQMLESGRVAVAVVVNRVNAAREIHARLHNVVANNADVHLLTGRMRGADRDDLEQTLLPRIRAGRSRQPDDHPIIVVATQSIEAGADFDFDGLVTECASLDALRQRFGRLDRLGELGGSARGVIVARTDTLENDAVYGDAIGHTSAWLAAMAEAGTLDFGIDALSLPAGAEVQRLLAPVNHAPVLLPSHLDAWAQTAPAPAAEPDVALWLHGPQSGAADVQVIWRADLSAELLAAAVGSGESAQDAEQVCLGAVDTLTPASGEAMSVPFLAVRRWLSAEPEPQVADVEGAPDADGDPVPAARTPALRAVIVWKGDDSRVVLPADLHPGQTIIVPASYGGIAHGNWSPESAVAVRDIAEQVAWRQRGRAVLRLHPAVTPDLLAGHVAPLPPSSEEPELDDRVVVSQWLDSLEIQTFPDAVQPLVESLRLDRRLRVERSTASTGNEAWDYFVVTGSRAGRGRHGSDGESVTDGNSSSFTGAAVSLARHSAGVAAQVATFGERIGLAPEVIADLRLAAEWHDAGKADPRFQRWLHGGSAFKALTQTELLAKGTVNYVSRIARSEARERSGYPAGSRHEALSVALMTSVADRLAKAGGDWALVLHLVASHHGHARPFLPWTPDPNPIVVEFERDDLLATASSDHQLERLDSGVGDRFWDGTRTYGWWGLAWLEAMLRLADHAQSATEQETRAATRA